MFKFTFFKVIAFLGNGAKLASWVKTVGNYVLGMTA